MCRLSVAVSEIDEIRLKVSSINALFSDRICVDAEIMPTRDKKSFFINLRIKGLTSTSPSFGGEGVSPNWIRKKIHPILDKILSEKN